MKLTQLLLEFSISIEDALSILNIGIEDASDDEKLKKAYREASKLAHPDRGGTTEDMQKVNISYDILKKHRNFDRIINNNSKINKEDRDKQLFEMSLYIREEILRKFKPKVFLEFFENEFNMPFTFNFISVYPKDYSEFRRKSSITGFDGEFKSHDNETVFSININTSIYRDIEEYSMGINNLQYSLLILAYGFHNNKKQKLSSSVYKFSHNHEILEKPELIFPKNKIKKISSGESSNRKFMKRDMFLFITRKLNGRIDDKYAIIPIDEEYKIVFHRMALGTIAMWGVNGLYKKDKKINNLISYTFEESETQALEMKDFVDIIRKNIKRKDEKNIIEFINKEILKIKQKYDILGKK